MYVFAQNKIEPANKIAFLRDQAVWLANPDGSGEQRLTNKSVKVNDFLFSPTLQYLAYSAIVGSAEEPGLWDSTETAPQRAICSIVIFDLATNKKLKQTDSEWVYITRWLPQDRLLYYTSDGYAVSGYYAYDARKNSMLTMPDGDERLTNSDFSLDGSLEAYVGSYGRDLYMHYVDTNRDTVLVSGKFYICDVRISNNKRHVSFVQVQDEGQKYFDILWLYERKTSSCTSLHRGPAHAKSGGVNYLAWSPDDRYIGMFFPPEAIVLEIEHPSRTITVSGKNFCWLANDKIIFTRDNDTYVYDLTTSSSSLLIKGADMAVLLR